MLKTDPPAPPAAAALTRRGLFQLGAAGAALAASPLAAQGFGRGFTHGVASGEPAANSVLLWTRFAAPQNVTLDWEVSETLDFARTVSAGKVIASPARDHCAKTIASGLTPGRWYYYRFVAPDGQSSEIGRTRTLPEGATSRFRMAVFSCSNYGFGWFNAYAHAAEANDADLTLHLGDYIYEYGRGTYPSPGDAHPERVLSPESEIVALADYRLRYATYRSDPDLRRLHQVMPMIAVWDDHESANDSWEGGAQNHQGETEGSWDARKAVAKQAYREWMPVSDEPYARYEVGDLATLFRLDTRLEGREKQFDLGSFIEGTDEPERIAAQLTRFREGDWADPSRQLLGAAQEGWLADGLRASTAGGTRWQVLVQQVLMGRLSTPPGVLALVNDAMPDFVRRRLTAAALAARAGLPANMDAWDGYPAARDRVLAAAREADANLVVLAGDTHNGWAFELDHGGEAAGVEFATQSVSSPGLESSLSMLAPADFARMATEANSQLAWADTGRRGYMLVELTPDHARSEFRFTGDMRTRSAALAGTHVVSAPHGARRFAT